MKSFPTIMYQKSKTKQKSKKTVTLYLVVVSKN